MSNQRERRAASLAHIIADARLDLEARDDGCCHCRFDEHTNRLHDLAIDLTEWADEQGVRVKKGGRQ